MNTIYDCATIKSCIGMLEDTDTPTIWDYFETIKNMDIHSLYIKVEIEIWADT